MHSLAKHEDFDRRHTQKLILRLIENRVIRVYLNGGEEKCAERRILSIVGFFFFWYSSYTGVIVQSIRVSL